MVSVPVVFQFLLGREIFSTNFASIFIMPNQVSQVLLLPHKELSTSLTGVLGVVLVLLRVLLHLLLVLHDLPALQADHLAPHGVLGVVSPQTGFLDKLSCAELAVIIFLSRGDVVDSLEVGHEQPPLGELCLALVTVVVAVAQHVLVQLEGGQEGFRTFGTFVNCLFSLLVSIWLRLRSGRL